MDIGKIRSEIDIIDQQLMKLLNRRFELSLQVSEFKKFHDLPIIDKKREKEIIMKISDYTVDEQIALAIKATYREIFKESRKLQK